MATSMSGIMACSIHTHTQLTKPLFLRRKTNHFRSFWFHTAIDSRQLHTEAVARGILEGVWSSRGRGSSARAATRVGREVGE